MFIVLTADSSKDVVPRVRIHTYYTNTCVCACVFLICPIKKWPLTVAAGKAAQKRHQQPEESPAHSETFTQIEPDLWLYRKELEDEAEEGKVSELKYLDRKMGKERMVQDKNVGMGLSRQGSHSAVLATPVYMVCDV